jgi:AraC-like DNA-binding protein
MKHLEQMQIEVTAASETLIGPLPANPRDMVYDCNRYLYVTSGKGRLQALNQDIELVQGTLCVLLNGVAHRVIVAPGDTLTIKWCHFHMSYGDREIYRLLALPITAALEDAEYAGALFDRLIQEMRKDRLTSRLRVKAAMLELISMYLESIPEGNALTYPTPELQKIEAVLKYIDEHLAENITVEELAKQVYLHPNYFIVFFKSFLGFSPIQYVNHRRMEVAKKLLLQPDCNISDVAARIGMQLYYFSRMFKAHTGLTPSRYRKQAFCILESGAET